MPPERRVYGHVDMDAFYVSVELQSRPELAGEPVVVAGSGPRAVVTTASYEARKFGVFSATPAERARRLCPQAVFIPPDFEKYRSRSREVMAVLREHVDRVEVVGLDEAYLDLTPIERPKAAARRLKHDVRERTGLTCSIGIGPNKLVAKVASDADKPDGFVVLSREQACEHFAGASPGLIPGIGPKTRAGGGGRGVPAPAAPGGEGPHDTGRAGRDPGGESRRLVRRAARPAPRRARALRGRPRAPDRPPAKVRVARDDLRLRPARAGRARAGAAAAHRPAVRDARQAGKARSDDRHQGPARRLLDPHPRALTSRGDERRGRGPRRGARPAARVRSAAAGAPDRRAGGGAGRGPRGAGGGPARAPALGPGAFPDALGLHVRRQRHVR